MKFTIEEALLRAVKHHRAGKLQDAENLYRAILQAQPHHPDANHNLGVLAVSVNKSKVALPLFKIALEANPNQEQFWLSYLDALIKEKQFDNARNVLEQGKKRGFAGEKIDLFEEQLLSFFSRQNVGSVSTNIFSNVTYQPKKISSKKVGKTGKNLVSLQQISPSQNDLIKLLEYFQGGCHDLAENLAMTLTQQYPKHPFGWKVLGALFKQSGKFQDAVNANQKVLELSPNDVEAHYNLGNTLKELGRLEDADVSYKKAILINPNLATVHYNLGLTLQELGRLQDAISSYKNAIAIKPDYAQAYGNIGNIHQELGKLEDAESSYKKAIEIMPDFAEAHCNLGSTLKYLGRLEEAETFYKKAVSIDPKLAEAHYNLGSLLKELGRLAEAEASCVQAIRLKPDHIEARIVMLTCLYLMNKETLFFDNLDYLIRKNKADSVIGSFISRSELKYGFKKSNIFCNEPLNYAKLIDLYSRYNFEEVFIQNVKSILSEDKRTNRLQTLLSNGYQTSGNLFIKENNFIKEIESSIRTEIEKYRTSFQGGKEGFITKWPSEYSLYGWIIVMKSGGELQPHIHENGWLTGSIYINVPPKSKIDSGNLVVAIGKDSDTTHPSLNSKKIIDVVTGSMALFPASLMHHTIPFESEEERIVLAFDVVPK